VDCALSKLTSKLLSLCSVEINHTNSRDSQVSEEAQTAVFRSFGQATEFWRCAVSLEPVNRSLAGNIDMAMRLFVGMPVPAECKYRDPSLYPKSLADATVIARLQYAHDRKIKNSK